MALKNAGYTKSVQVFKFMIAEASIIVIGMTASIFAPSFAAVLIIASHSLISSFNLIYEINISAYLSISVFTGLMIKFWITEGLLSNGMERLKPKNNWQNILPLLPIIGTLLVGIYGESLTTNSGLNFEFNRSELLTLLQHPTSLVNSINVVTRWFSYGMIAYLGLKFTTPDRFLIQFALVCASQIFFFDTSYLIELYNQVKITLIFPGFDWLAFNRAYFAYELSVSAASLFIFGSRETKKNSQNIEFLLMLLLHSPDCNIGFQRTHIGPINITNCLNDHPKKKKKKALIKFTSCVFLVFFLYVLALLYLTSFSI